MSEERTNGQEDLAERRYEPPQGFAENAIVNDPSIYERANQDPDAFWEECARDLHWFKEWDQVLKWDPPEVQWFVGGKTNVSYNCLDKNIEEGKGDKTALMWEGDETGATKSYTYNELSTEASKSANVPKTLRVQKGTRVGSYLTMSP